MNLLRFAAALLFLTISCFPQAIDYRALGTNSYFTNGFIVNDKHWTNQSGLYLYQPKTGTVVNGQPGPPFVLRSDGSIFIGTNVFQDVSPTLSGIFAPYVISMTDSNEPTTLHGTWFAIDSENYGVYATLDFTVQQAGLSTFRMSGDAGTEVRGLTVNTGSGQQFLDYQSNSVSLFGISETGDLIKIKGLTYSWPTIRGGANSILSDIDNSGTLRWTNIAAIVTNNQARIGPGTNNFIAKFNVVGGTNVGNSPLYSADTNYVWQRQSAVTGATYTNSATNKIFSIETANAATNMSLEFVAGDPFGNQVSHIRNVGAFQNQRPAIYINDSWAIEPSNNPLAGHPTAGMYPVADNVSTLGSSSQRILSATFGTGFIELGVPASTSFPGIRVGASDCGISSRGVNDLSFWRPTIGSPTAAFDKERNSGSLQFDLAGNYLGFGVGLSNTVAFLGGNDQIISSLGLVGHTQIGTNSTVSYPTNVGFIGAPGVGTDKGGSMVQIIGGPSSGTGTNGDVAILTSEKANTTSTSINSNQKTRFRTIADPIILTTNSATTVFSFTVPTTLKAAGVTVFSHTEIENGVDIAATDEHFIVNAVNKAGTLTVSTPSAPITTTSSSGGSASIANSWSAAATGTRVDVKLTCITSGILSTNSTVRVTLIPNSSAVPVIAHP